MPAKVERQKYICNTCGKDVYKLPSQMKGKTLAFCNNACRYEFRRKNWSPATKLSNEFLLLDLFKLSRELGRPPKAKDINARYSGRSIVYGRRFGSVSNANKLAGVPYIDQMLKEIIRVYNQIGHTPTDQEFRNNGRISVGRYWDEFGSWSKACMLAGLIPHTTGEGVPKTKFYSYARKDGTKIKFQGTFESRFSIVLDLLDLHWLSHGEFPPIIYFDESGKPHKYRPDFYVKEWDTYIETKGWYQDKDKLKMSFVSKDNPHLKIIVVKEQELRYFEKHHRLP